MSGEKRKGPDEGIKSPAAEILADFKAYCAHMERTVHGPRREAEREEQHRRDLKSGAAREDLYFK